MSAISAGTIIYRDFIQYVLPTLFALCLFVPFFNPYISVDVIGLSAIVFGYVVFVPVDWLLDLLLKRFKLWAEKSSAGMNKTGSSAQVGAKQHQPSVLARLRHCFAQNYHKAFSSRDWHQRNWDYDRLWYHGLDKEERENFSVSEAFFELYRFTAFYFLAYALLNFIWALWGIGGYVILGDFGGDILTSITTTATPMLGGWSAPTWLVMIISAIWAFFLGRAVFGVYRNLFGEDGAYVKYSTKYHEAGGKIAQSVWGRVVYQEEDGKKQLVPVPGVKIRLYRDSRELAPPRCTDEQGRFQMVDTFSKCVGGTCTVVVVGSGWQVRQQMYITEKTVPEFTIRVKRASQNVRPCTSAGAARH